MVSESTEERETEMSGLITRFAMRMRKRVANAQGETFFGLEVQDEKCFKRSGLDKEIQADPIVIPWTRQNESLRPRPLLGVPPRQRMRL